MLPPIIKICTLHHYYNNVFPTKDQSTFGHCTLHFASDHLSQFLIHPIYRMNIQNMFINQAAQLYAQCTSVSTQKCFPVQTLNGIQGFLDGVTDQ